MEEISKQMHKTCRILELGGSLKVIQLPHIDIEPSLEKLVTCSSLHSQKQDWVMTEVQDP